MSAGDDRRRMREIHARESLAEAEWAKVKAINAQTSEIRKLAESVAFLLENAVLRSGGAAGSGAE